MIINALSDRKSRDRQEERKSGGGRSFGQILTEQAEQMAENSFEGMLVGYARNGQVYFGQTMQRTYN